LGVKKIDERRGYLMALSSPLNRAE